MKIEELQGWDERLRPHLLPYAQGELQKVANPELALRAMAFAFAIWKEEELLMVVGMTKAGGKLGRKPELWVLGGTAFKGLKLSEWKELRRMFSQFLLGGPLFVRIANNAPQAEHFAKFFGFRLRHQREAFSYYEVD